MGTCWAGPKLGEFSCPTANLHLKCMRWVDGQFNTSLGGIDTQGVLQGTGRAQTDHSEMHIAQAQVSTNIPASCSALQESHGLMEKCPDSQVLQGTSQLFRNDNHLISCDHLTMTDPWTLITGSLSKQLQTQIVVFLRTTNSCINGRVCELLSFNIKCIVHRSWELCVNLNVLSSFVH